MNETYLLLGSNEGDRLLFIEKAMLLLERVAGYIVRKSSVYETKPWGMNAPSSFLNIVILLKTDLSPGQLLTVIQSIEKRLFRVRQNERYTSRTIDIDILFFGEMIINEQVLIIPHPELHKRRFALVPLDEINPALVHPVFNKTVNLLLRECPDKLEVIRTNAVI